MSSPNSHDSYINKPAPQLFPAAQAMKKTTTTIASGIVPGVNTLVPPAVKQAQVEAARPVAAAHNLTEDEVLKQKQFAARLLGSSAIDVPVLANVSPNWANDAKQDFAMDGDWGGMAHEASGGVDVGVRPRRKGLLPIPHQEGEFSDQHMPRGEQFNFHQHAHSREISNTEVGNFMSSSINNESRQEFHQQQQQRSGLLMHPQHHNEQLEEFAQQRFQGGMQLDFQLGIGSHQQTFDFRQQQPHFDIDERKSRKSRVSWLDREENATVIRGTVKGAFGKSRQMGVTQPPQMPVSTRPSLLGPYPGAPPSNNLPQASFFSGHSTNTTTSNTMVLPTISTEPNLQLQPNFKETLRDLSTAEKEILRKALLSGKMESLRLTSGQALEILQALKSITSGGQESKTTGSNSDWLSTMSTNWPDTPEESWEESKHQHSPSETSNQHRGLGAILEVLRSNEQVDELPYDGNDAWGRPSKEGITSVIGGQKSHLESRNDALQGVLSLQEVPSSSNMAMPGGSPTLSAQPINTDIISSIDENLEMLRKQREKLLKGQNSLPRQSRESQDSSTRKARSHSRDRFGDTRNGPGRVNTVLSRSAERERERDRNKCGDGVKGRDDVRSERRRSPKAEKERSRSRERNLRDRSGSEDRRNKRHLVNDQKGPQSQSGWPDRDGPDQKRRRLDDAQKLNQGIRTPTWSQQRGNDHNNRRPRENERSNASIKRSQQPQEEKKSDQESSKSQRPKPVPLLDIVIPPSAQRPSLNLSLSKKTPPKPPTAKTETTNSKTQASGSKAKTSDDNKTAEIKKQKKVEEKLTKEEAINVAATMKPSTLLEQICDGSTQHQLNLLKEIGVDEHVKDKEIVDWYCYVCGKFCTGWSIYLSHIEGRKHKANFRRLHQAEHAAIKETLIRKLGDLPDKAHGGPQHYSDIPHPSFAVRPPPQPHTTSSPLGRKDQAFFCGQCFRTYACTYEDHMASDDHKKYLEIRPKCSLCKLTFLNQKALRSHMNKLSHIRKAQESGVDPYKMDGIKVEPECKDVGEEDEKLTSEKTEISGTEFIVAVTGYYCKLCAKFYEKEQAAKAVHCGTPHHNVKVKQYYAKRGKSSGVKKNGDKIIKSGDEQDRTLQDHASPSKNVPTSKDAPPKNVLAKKDATPKKEVPPKDDSGKKSASTKDAPRAKDALPKKAVTPKDESAKKASTKDAPPIKDAPTKDMAIKKAASTKDAPPTKDVTPKDDSSKKDAQPNHSDKDRIHSTSSDKIEKTEENTSKENDHKELFLNEPKLVLSIPKMSLAAINEANAKASRERRSSSSDDAKPKRQTTHQESINKSDTPDSKEQESALEEMDTNSEIEVEGEWEGELPDFGNMIFIDEVGESDEEGT